MGLVFLFGFFAVAALAGTFASRWLWSLDARPDDTDAAPTRLEVALGAVLLAVSFALTIAYALAFTGQLKPIPLALATLALAGPTVLPLRAALRRIDPTRTIALDPSFKWVAPALGLVGVYLV